jgi:hypothetical protein
VLEVAPSSCDGGIFRRAEKGRREGLTPTAEPEAEGGEAGQSEGGGLRDHGIIILKSSDRELRSGLCGVSSGDDERLASAGGGIGEVHGCEVSSEIGSGDIEFEDTPTV